MSSPWPPLADDPLGRRLQTVSILTRALARRLGDELGLNLTDLGAFEQLVTHGPLTPGDLAARLDVTTAAGTQIVDRLERAGHIHRERHAEDRRKVLVVPAPAAVARLYDELTPMLEALAPVVAALTPEHREIIQTFLDDIIAVYRRILDTPKPP